MKQVLRKVYDWTLERAGRPTAERWLAFISFADSSFFPVPPDVMLIPMYLAEPKKSMRYATVATVTSVLGALLGYLIGAVLYKTIGAPLLQFYGYEATFARFTEMVHQYGGWLMLAFAFLPIPYKVATIAAGSVGMSIPVLILASIAGRGGRFFLVAFLMRAYGDLARQLIDNHFNKLAMVFTGLLVGGFVVVHYAS